MKLVKVFSSMRDSTDIAKSGTIAGALRIPRGFLEFAATKICPVLILAWIKTRISLLFAQLVDRLPCWKDTEGDGL